MSEVLKMLWQPPSARLERRPVARTLATDSLLDEGEDGCTFSGGGTSGARSGDGLGSVGVLIWMLRAGRSC
jgi:hypothetical protein